MTAEQAHKAAEKLLPDVKLWLRRTGSKLDPEVTQTAAACLLDLQGAGIFNISVTDPLIQQAVKFYAKGHFGYDDHPERWMAAYEHLKAALSLNSDYTKPAVIPDG